MKILYSIAMLAGTMIFTGCTSTSKVQEMIDASHRDYLNRTDSHEASIDVLKKSAMTLLEKSKGNTATLSRLQAELKQTKIRLKTIQGYAEASKVLSAANTVKVADLENAMIANQEIVNATTVRLAKIDELYEGVMIAHYQLIAGSASAAIESLQEKGVTARTNAPVKIDAPIEIVAPDTAITITTGAFDE